MLLGVVGNPPVDGLTSEVRALKAAISTLQVAVKQIESGRVNNGVDMLVEGLKPLLEEMLKQVQSGVHVNGRPRVRGGRHRTSDHVQAIVYVHRENGKHYVHGFGDAHLDLHVRGNELRIAGLKDRTDVQMFAEPDGTVSIVGRSGQRLWEDFAR